MSQRYRKRQQRRIEDLEEAVWLALDVLTTSERLMEAFRSPHQRHETELALLRIRLRRVLGVR